MKGTREEEEHFFSSFFKDRKELGCIDYFYCFWKIFFEIARGYFLFANGSREYSIWRVKMSRVTNSSRLESKYINK